MFRLRVGGLSVAGCRPEMRALWAELDAAFHAELAQSNPTLQDFLKQRHPAWDLVGRVHFNLAEKRRDDAAPAARKRRIARKKPVHASKTATAVVKRERARR
jgi:hypothetical protein